MTKIITVQFDRGTSDAYKRMMNTYKKSIAVNMPNAELLEFNIPEPEVRRGDNKFFSANTDKLSIWLECVEKYNDNIALTDCDMLCVKDFNDVFNLDFDVAITMHEDGAILPLNGGVIFVKPTENAKYFMQLFKKVNDEMYNDKEFHQKWRDKYAGINQSAMGYILETGGYRANVLKLPCQIYNNCDPEWPTIDDNTRLVHIKGKLRQYVLRNYDFRAMPARIVKAASLWRKMEAM
jgi:hypothetical protein